MLQKLPTRKTSLGLRKSGLRPRLGFGGHHMGLCSGRLLQRKECALEGFCKE